MKLVGGKTFKEFDPSQAYEQVLLDEESQEVVTIITHRGLFRYKRLPYGVSSTPDIFQRAIEGTLQGIPHVGGSLDILVTGTMDEEHLSNLREVLWRLVKANVRLKRSKCKFMQSTLVTLATRLMQMDSGLWRQR